MFYHASQVKDIKMLEPRVSNHKIPLIYFSDKRENVLVYLSNAIEKYCKETNYNHNGIYSKWGPYGFTKDGRLELQEYYPNATYETYKGVSAYIYHIKDVPNIQKQKDIPHTYTTDMNTKVDSYEYIEDAYEEIMKAVAEGKIVLVKYNDFIKEHKEWLIKNIKKEYEEAEDQLEYRYFLKEKFPFLNK